MMPPLIGVPSGHSTVAWTEFESGSAGAGLAVVTVGDEGAPVARVLVEVDREVGVGDPPHPQISAPTRTVATNVAGRVGVVFILRGGFAKRAGAGVLLLHSFVK
jgi:hypothetical protein